MKKLLFIPLLCTSFAISVRAPGFSSLASLAGGSVSSMMGGSATGGYGGQADFSGGQASGLAAINPNSIGSSASYGSPDGAMSADEAAQYASSQGIIQSSNSGGDWGGSSAYPSGQPQFQSSSGMNYGGQGVVYPPGTPGQPLVGPDGQPILGPDGQPLMAPAGTAGQPNIIINTSQPSPGSSPTSSDGSGMNTGQIVGTSVGGAGALTGAGTLALLARRRRSNSAAQSAAPQTDQFGNPVFTPTPSIDSKAQDFGDVVEINGKKTIKKASVFRRYLLMNADERAKYDAKLKENKANFSVVQKISMGLDPLHPTSLALQTPGMPQTPPPPVARRSSVVDSDVVPYGSRITTKDGKESIKLASEARQLTWSAKEKADYRRLVAESEQELLELQNYNISTSATYRKAGLKPPPAWSVIDISVLPYGSLITKANGQESIKTASAARQLTWSDKERADYKRRTQASTAVLKSVKKMDTRSPGPLGPQPHVIRGVGLTTPVPRARQPMPQHAPSIPARRPLPQRIQPAHTTAHRVQMMRPH